MLAVAVGQTAPSAPRTTTRSFPSTAMIAFLMAALDESQQVQIRLFSLKWQSGTIAYLRMRPPLPIVHGGDTSS